MLPIPERDAAESARSPDFLFPLILPFYPITPLY